MHQYHSRKMRTVIALLVPWSVLLVCTERSLGFQIEEASSTSIPNPFDFLPPDEPAQQQEQAEVDNATDLDDDLLPANDAQAPDAIQIEKERLGEAILQQDTEQALASKEPQPAVDTVLEARYKRCLVIDIEGDIFRQFYYYLNNRLNMAESIGADLIVLRLTSPGGDMEMSLELAKRLREITWAKVVVAIPREAISGGAIISLGADRIYMVKGALIGDAGAIKLGVRGFELAEPKIVSYLTAELSELAKSSGRPPAIAQAMADKDQIVLEVIDKQTGEKAYLREEEVEKAPQNYDIQGPIPEAGQNRFLTLGADKAFEYGLAEGVFASEDEIMQQLLVDEFQYTRINWVDRTVVILNTPWLTGLLLIVGLIGLYMELIAPGLSVAGLTSVLCFGIFFWSHALGGTSGWLEVLLFGLAVFCLICELFIVPGFGVFGITGLVLLVVSLVMASQDFVVPQTESDWRSLQTNVTMVLGAILGVLVLFFVQILLLDRIPGFSKFQLVAPEDSVDQPAENKITSLTAASGNSPLPSLGAQGIADSDLRPSGKVFVEHQLLDVVTEGDYVEAGSSIEIIKIEGNTIIVRKVST